MSDVQALAELLAEHVPLGFRCECGWDSHQSATYATEHAAHVAAVLAEAGLLRVEDINAFYYDWWKNALRERDAARAELADMTARADERRIMCDERDALVTRWHERAEKAEAERDEWRREEESTRRVAAKYMRKLAQAEVERDRCHKQELQLLERAQKAERKHADLVAAVRGLADECASSDCIHLNDLWGRLRNALDGAQ